MLDQTGGQEKMGGVIEHVNEEGLPGEEHLSCPLGKKRPPMCWDVWVSSAKFLGSTQLPQEQPGSEERAVGSGD